MFPRYPFPFSSKKVLLYGSVHRVGGATKGTASQSGTTVDVGDGEDNKLEVVVVVVVVAVGV